MESAAIKYELPEVYGGISDFILILYAHETLLTLKLYFFIDFDSFLGVMFYYMYFLVFYLGIFRFVEKIIKICTVKSVELYDG